MELCKNDERRYRAICFDLDGTLLPMDIDEFMREYFGRIAKFMGKRGVDADRFLSALKAGTRSMAMHVTDETNEEAYWKTFFDEVGSLPFSEDEMRLFANEFYDTDFVHIGDGFEANPLAAQVLKTLENKGYPLVLTTMPMFPRRAVEHRLAWAGVDPAIFKRITNYSNSKSVKPRQTYYAENLAAMGLSGRDVLMVGNNTMEDLSFLDLGADGYLVTDCLLDPVGYDMDTVKHGPFSDFAKWVDSLPECANPATDINDGVIAFAATKDALDTNLLDGVDLEVSSANAAAVADAVAGDHEPGAADRLKGMKVR